MFVTNCPENYPTRRWAGANTWWLILYRIMDIFHSNVCSLFLSRSRCDRAKRLNNLKPIESFCFNVRVLYMNACEEVSRHLDWILSQFIFGRFYSLDLHSKIPTTTTSRDARWQKGRSPTKMTICLSECDILVYTNAIGNSRIILSPILAICMRHTYLYLISSISRKTLLTKEINEWIITHSILFSCLQHILTWFYIVFAAAVTTLPPPPPSSSWAYNEMIIFIIQAAQLQCEWIYMCALCTSVCSVFCVVCCVLCYVLLYDRRPESRHGKSFSSRDCLNQIVQLGKESRRIAHSPSRLWTRPR